ncbi:uncharacterized protein B0H18DRAFT_1019215 [Fomitopsis serialis]|uniref:uncharacterized protein n=1 Tax=Fomitopsis serialis TaxID=139415 RepID=UPI0020079085|nr:uncharacterized protein B0H18DRAFT_1019215 [Neoantrodia serialis]KAH9922120.1 hypothetical protein B0H18DRAFT_1019215 [Neoantrodia serialis]
MSNASPTAYLLWTILSVLFLGFLIYHLWSYDRFQCLRWSAGRQPGAFKRVMTYSYLASVPLFTVYSIAYTVLKYREVFPRPIEMYSDRSRAWVLPLNFVFSFAWALELVTHLEELAFWLYLLHQRPEKGEWFESWEYRFWYWGSIVSIIGMPLTCMIARRHLDTLDAYIFLSGSCGSLSTTVAFLYVLWRFPRFIRHVKSEGADPTVVVRLATFYQLNLARVVFRFLFTVPLLMLALDAIVGSSHPLNSHLYVIIASLRKLMSGVDFLVMIGGVGCFVSSAITLLVHFFPRSILREAGYKPKPTSTVHHSPKHTAPPSSRTHHPHSAPVFSPSGHHHFTGALSHPQLHHIASLDQLPRAPSTHGHSQHQFSAVGGGDGVCAGPEHLEGEVVSTAVSPHESMVDVAVGGGETIEEADEGEEAEEGAEEEGEGGDAPPYSHMRTQNSHYHPRHDHPRDHHPHPRPHSFPYPRSPHSFAQSPPSSPPSRPHSQILLPTSVGPGSPQETPAQNAVNNLYQRHPFPHTLSSPQIPQNAQPPPGSPPAGVGVARRASSYVSKKPPLREGDNEMQRVRESGSERGQAREGWGAPREGYRRGAPRLHPYVMTFTSPIDLVDLSTPEELPGEMPSGRRSP